MELVGGLLVVVHGSVTVTSLVVDVVVAEQTPVDVIVEVDSEGAVPESVTVVAPPVGCDDTRTVWVSVQGSVVVSMTVAVIASEVLVTVQTPVDVTADVYHTGTVPESVTVVTPPEVSGTTTTE